MNGQEKSSYSEIVHRGFASATTPKSDAVGVAIPSSFARKETMREESWGVVFEASDFVAADTSSTVRGTR